MRTQRALALMLVLVLVASVAAAGSQAGRAELQAGGFHAGPETTIITHPRFFAAEPTLLLQPRLPPEFTVSAERLHVEVDTTEAAVETGPLVNIVPGNTSRADYGAARVEGLQNGDSYRIVAVPLNPEAALTTTTDCSDPAFSETNEVRRIPLAYGSSSRDPVVVDVSNAVRWQDCSLNAQLTFQGDYLLAVWDWTFQVKDEEGTTTYQTGKQQHPSASGLPDASGTVSQDHEAWLYVYNGTFTLTLVQGSAHTLYAQPGGSLHSQAGLLFRDAVGEVDVDGQQHRIGGNEVYLRGDLEARLEQASREGFRTVVEGDFQGIVVDRQTFALPAPGGGDDGNTAWIVAGLGTLVLILAVLKLFRRTPPVDASIQSLPRATWRQRQGSALTIRARNALDRHPRQARVLAHVASWFIHHHPQLLVERATIYHRLRRPNLAQRVHERLDAALVGDAREQCRNAWQASQGFRTAQPSIAADWQRKAEGYDYHEYLRLKSESMPPYHGRNSQNNCSDQPFLSKPLQSNSPSRPSSARSFSKRRTSSIFWFRTAAKRKSTRFR